MIDRMGPYGLFDLPKLGFNVIAIPTFEGKYSRPSLSGSMPNSRICVPHF